MLLISITGLLNMGHALKPQKVLGGNMVCDRNLSSAELKPFSLVSTDDKGPVGASLFFQQT